jgi:glutamine amidotransferase
VITIVDYGAGNLCSVVNAVTSLGYESKVTSSPQDVRDARAVIVPGVGAAADAMANLERLRLVDPIRQLIVEGRPFFGICLGLQLLFAGTDEGGRHECLGVFPGWVKRLPPQQKIPHMGWNQVKQVATHPIFDGIADESNFYFVHSYYAQPDDRSLVAGETEYTTKMCSVVARGNLVATQFHPEKSGKPGLRMYDNFIRLVMGQG